MLRNNYNQREFAQKIGITGPALAQLINGNRNPSPRTRAALLEASGLDFDTLFTIHHDEPKIKQETAL